MVRYIQEIESLYEEKEKEEKEKEKVRLHLRRRIEDPRSRMARVLSGALDSAARRLKQNRENTEKLASLIEAKLWTKFGAINPSYQRQMRSICLNLNDPKNNDFARRVFEGTIPQTCRDASKRIRERASFENSKKVLKLIYVQK